MCAVLNVGVCSNLHSGQGVPIVLTGHQVLLLVDPGLLLIYIGTELLVGQGVFQFLASVMEGEDAQVLDSSLNLKLYYYITNFALPRC